MKLLLILVFTIVSQLIFAQKKVNFSLKYSPDKKYTQTTKETSETEMWIVGGENIPEDQRHKIISEKGKKISLITTGKRKENGDIDMEMTFEEVESTDAAKKMLEDMTIYGHANDSVFMALDSVDQNHFGASDELQFIKSLEAAFSQFKFEDVEIEVGDTVSLDMPFNMPIPGMQFKSMINTTYILRSIKGNNANFDVLQTLEGTMNGDGMVMRMHLDGKGDMIYSIKDQFYTETNLDMVITGQMKIDGGIVVKLKVNTTTEQEIQIK